jgi:hypothetical protein
MCRVCAFDVGSALAMKASYYLLLSSQSATQPHADASIIDLHKKVRVPQPPKRHDHVQVSWRGREITTASRRNGLDRPTNGR